MYKIHSRFQIGSKMPQLVLHRFINIIFKKHDSPKIEKILLWQDTLCEKFEGKGF